MSADGEQGGVLLPCPNPWCEGVEGVEASRHIVTEKWRVCCDDCMIEGPWADTCDLAFAAWNTRAAPATDTPEVVRKAVNLAYDLLMEVEQTTSNVWWVNVDDPEVAVSDTLDALEEARAALAKHPTSPEAAA